MTRHPVPELDTPEPFDADALPLGVVDGMTGYHLRRASAVFAADFARTMDGLGMRQALFAILSIVMETPGVNQGAVGRALGIQRANMVALINDLVDRGLVDRTVAPADRRAFALRITDKGRDLVARCMILLDAHEDAMLAHLDTDERTMLVSLLRKIEG